MALPAIIKDRCDLVVNEQLSVQIFPDDEGQPKCDVLKLSLTQLEGTTADIYLTPCEALTIAAALNSAVEFYLYNQEQYRKEILEPREKIAAQRNKERCSTSANKRKPKSAVKTGGKRKQTSAVR